MRTVPKVLAFCSREIPSALIGVNMPLQQIMNQGHINFSFVETAKITKKDIAESDIVICIRGVEEWDLEIVNECHRLKKYLIYYLDDDLTNVTEKSVSYDYFQNKKIKNNIHKIMELCDCLWTSSPLIEQKFKVNFAFTVITDAPALLLEETNNNVSKEKNKIIIGFAGGIDHQFFLDEFMEIPIRKVVEKYKEKVSFEFFGAKPKYIDKYNCSYIPYQKSHEEYKKTISTRNWDIALAPLPDSDFHACKYFNKFLEYGAIGAAGIYSNVQPYVRIVRDGINGLLIDNTLDNWFNAMCSLIESSELRKLITEEALKEVTRDFSLKSVGEKVFLKFPQFKDFKAPYCEENNVILPVMNKNFILSKLISIIKSQGINTPIYIYKRILLYTKTKF